MRASLPVQRKLTLLGATDAATRASPPPPSTWATTDGEVAWRVYFSGGNTNGEVSSGTLHNASRPSRLKI